MAALDFPTSPTNGQYYQGYVWNAANSTWDSSYQADTLKPGLTQIIAPTIRASGGAATSNTLGTVSFTNVSSIALDGVITSAYKNYKILFDVDSSSATVAVNFRYTTSGVATSTSDWWTSGAYWGIAGAGTSTAVGGAADVAVNVILGSGYNNKASFSEITLTNNRLMCNYSGFPNGSGGSLSYGNWNAVPPHNFDGFRLTPTSGTMTGTVSIYGIAV